MHALLAPARLARTLLAGAAACALAAGGLAAAPTSVEAIAKPRSACPAGQHLDPLARFARAGTPATCVPVKESEGAKDQMKISRALQVKHQGNYPVTGEAFASAVAQSAALPASKTYGGSAWKPLGTDALYADVADYDQATGLHNLSGRIEGFAYDPADPKIWYALVANGGVYRSTNAGSSWSSIGDGLPSQIMGGLAIAKGGTLVIGSGDSAFGGDSYSGLGAFWSSDHGATWHHARGVPNGTITFRVAVDPIHTNIVYQATGKGLWRSTDAGRSYTNVVLPTTCTSLTKPTCFFANIVSDVVVRPYGGTGPNKSGGQVLAAVGWRAGTKLNAAGTPQAPRDGIYYSATGAPGTFTFMDPAATGFPLVDRAGRTALGIAYGPTQNHDYVYALVQDPSRFNKQTQVGDTPALPPTGTPVNSTLNPTVLNGLYGTSDFGKHWTLMADADQMDAPTHQSALGGTFCVLGYCAGVQSWYNEWVQPSPAASLTAEDGTPQFLSFGLEEVWGGSAVIPPVPNTSNFGVFGRYFSGSTCLALTVPGLQGFCPTTSGASPQGSTVHPDQHAVMYVPSGRDATIVVGNDGGAFMQKQQNAGATPFDNDHWANGINHGLHTLLPYDAEMSSDGTVYAGLQDNGELKITPEGKQIMTQGGDAFFSAVDPDRSNVAYEEYVGGDINVTTDGGKSWTDIQPCYSEAQFSAPFLMDPTNAKHLVAGGSQIAETIYGPNTTTAAYVGLTSNDVALTCGPGDPVFGSSTDWKLVFDLGSTNGYTNTASAVDVREDSIYAGYCGSCDIVTEGLPFHSGIATNVGGSRDPKRMTGNGWHFAAAKGLPQRIINSVLIDPKNDHTVYVTLGGYGRRWIPPGSLADDTSKVGEGHVFVSRDAGEHFTDISGNLPDLAANFAVLHDGDLIVANDLGVYSLANAAKATNASARYFVVGKGLPVMPVVHLQMTPRNRNELLAATYGRGVYVITLKPGSVPGGPTSGVLPTRGGKKPSSGGQLAATGLPAGLALLSLLLLGSGLAISRRVG
ncbi:MAG: WD40/YVTN/BNR-like repeat-containing protein [Mycobacteriales bacterium]